MTKLADLKKRLGADPAFQTEYEKADIEYALIETLIRTRTAANLTQAELAKRLGTTQSTIARLKGGRTSPSITTLKPLCRGHGNKATSRAGGGRVMRGTAFAHTSGYLHLHHLSELDFKMTDMIESDRKACEEVTRLQEENERLGKLVEELQAKLDDAENLDRAALAASPARVVDTKAPENIGTTVCGPEKLGKLKVRALVWEETACYYNSVLVPNWIANHMDGLQYDILFTSNKYECCLLYVGDESLLFDSLEEAQAAAQADFERRILSALMGGESE